MAIEFFNTYIAPEAALRVSELLSTTLLSEGKITALFEEELCATFGFKNLVSLNSGTSALHLALDLLNIKEGDEVIIPAQTFVATGLAVLYCGAKPVFADINYHDGNIDPESVKKKITARTKAVICVHWGGYPCDMEALEKICASHQLKLIDDAAHALGAICNNRPIGTSADITCFSFQAIKHLTTGDGGAITVRDNTLYDKALAKKWFGIDRKNSPVSELGERMYDITDAGYKYHLNNYAAALGLANLNGYTDRLGQRQKIAGLYDTGLKDIKGIQLPVYKNDRTSAYWLYPMLVEKRLDFISALKSRGIPTSVVHQRIDRNSVFGGISPDLENQTKFDEHQIHIPIHDAITGELAGKILHEIRKGW